MYNKSDLIKRMVKRYNIGRAKNVYAISQADAENMFNLVFNSMWDLIMDSNENGLNLHGIIKLEVVEQKPRKARNPKNGEVFITEPKFKLTSKLSPRIKNLSL